MLTPKEEQPPLRPKPLGRCEQPDFEKKLCSGTAWSEKKKTTDYGEQLYAKQRLKVYYGNISEKQFHKYYVEAIRRKGDTAENLIGLLESRLDNLVYKAKFVPTVFAARQFVNHGHVTVNGKKVNIPSYQLKAGDVIEVRENPNSWPLFWKLFSPRRAISRLIWKLMPES